MIFKGIIIILGIVFCILIGAILYFGYLEESESIDQIQDDQTEKTSEIARQFIQSSSTFSFDELKSR